MDARWFVLLLSTAISLSPAQAGPKEDLLAADSAFSALSAAKGSHMAFLFYLAEDGRMFGVGSEPPIYGKAAAVASFAKQSDAGTLLSWTPQHAGLSDDGGAGWTDGVWTFAGAANAKGERGKATGHYLTVWKKDASGRWRVEADMGTVDPASSK
ncbi:MAG: nuclear transport factor 2 family protein [Alphaproteobacteria bacterium]|nr:nuclear transport factor 2 family protein [Alphaproteobacteria bacterium]MDE2629820.1 nuclear transport factor 2 family protein [Alphaproteobacteria bacterium]